MGRPRTMLTVKQPRARPREPGAPWSVREVAAFLRVSERFLFDYIRTGAVRCIPMGAKRLIPDSEVSKIAEHGLPPLPASGTVSAPSSALVSSEPLQSSVNSENVESAAVQTA